MYPSLLVAGDPRLARRAALAATLGYFFRERGQEITRLVPRAEQRVDRRREQVAEVAARGHGRRGAGERSERHEREEVEV